MSEWRRVKLGDLGRVVTGATPPTKKPEYYDGNYQFVTPSDLVYDTWGVSKTERTISDEGHQKYLTRCVPAGAVMYTCIASIGKIGVAKDTVLTNQQINSIIANDENDGRFIYHLLRYNTDRIRGLNAGCAVPIINKTDFENIEVSAPKLPTQRRIADILSAYDDLIENNRRRIEILEETARTLYQKMFVAEAKPEWKKVSLATLADRIASGGTPKSSVEEYYQGEIKWYSTKELQDGYLIDSTKHISVEALNNSAAKLFPAGTVLMAIYAAPTVGRLGILEDESCFNQAAVGIVPKKEVGPYFLFELLYSERDKLNQLSKGVAQQNLSVAVVKGYEMNAANLSRFRAFPKA